MMVRVINATVTVYAEQTEVNDEGDTISSFVKLIDIHGDVQPHALTTDQLKEYGIDTKKSNVRLFLYNGNHAEIKAGNRCIVDSAYTLTTDWFSIMPINQWSRHGECILVPVENEEVEAENEDSDERPSETD